MILSGLKSRYINQNSNLEFDLNISLDSLKASGEFGFSGENNIINFKFISGRIYDFDNNYVYSYLKNQNINISGDIQNNNYYYSVNQKPVAIGEKNNFKINTFYTNSKDCNLDVDLVIKSPAPNYSLSINNIYYINQNLTGIFINNNLNSEIRIFTGEVTQNTGFKLINFTNPISGTGYFYIKTNPLLATYNLILYLYTDFGTITTPFIVSGLTGVI